QCIRRGAAEARYIPSEGPATPFQVYLSFSARCRCLPRLRRQWFIRLRPSITEELPGTADFRDHVEVEIGNNHFVFIATSLRNDLAARIAEVALAVEFADTPGFLSADAVDGADEISVRDGVRW